MTPLELTILIHHVTCRGRHESVSRGTVPYCNGLQMLLDNGLIDECDRLDSGENGYTGTAKGEFYLNHLCNIPFPVSKWEIPPQDK